MIKFTTGYASTISRLFLPRGRYFRYGVSFCRFLFNFFPFSVNFSTFRWLYVTFRPLIFRFVVIAKVLQVFSKGFAPAMHILVRFYFIFNLSWILWILTYALSRHYLFQYYEDCFISSMIIF